MYRSRLTGAPSSLGFVLCNAAVEEIENDNKLVGAANNRPTNPPRPFHTLAPPTQPHRPSLHNDQLTNHQLSLSLALSKMIATSQEKLQVFFLTLKTTKNRPCNAAMATNVHFFKFSAKTPNNCPTNICIYCVVSSPMPW